MTHCTDQNLGRLLAHYENGGLGEEESKFFELHLMECDYCHERLIEMRPVVSALHNHSEEFVEHLRQEGVQLDELKRQWMTSCRRRGFLSDLRTKWSLFWESLIRPRVWIPATSTVAAVFITLFSFLPKNQLVPTNYLAYLAFDKLSYQSMELRDSPETDAHTQFEKAMAYYLVDDYASAAAQLQRAVEMSPDRANWWLYLGVCYYLQNMPDQAIPALAKADSLSELSLQIKARWYLAQALLAKGDAGKAVPLLKWIQAQNRAYSGRADTLLANVDAADKQKTRHPR
jgi:tetratricopeptide (TPR) repeat protein